MGRTKSAVAGITLTAFGVALTADVVEGLKHVHLHTPASLFANVGSWPASAAAFDAGDCGPFRAIFPETLEALTDNVSQYVHADRLRPFELA